MSLVPQRASSRWKEWSPTPRWKEWIPLITQQQRLRNMVQVIAYNVPWYPGNSLYFTLHETTMSSPFYTSERLQHQHPKWGEIDTSGLPASVNTAATGLVIRLWLHQGQQSHDSVVLVWGVYFSGLIYLGPRIAASSTHFNKNSIVLHMQGGYFTDHHSLKEIPSNGMMRNLSIMLPIADIRPSYSVTLLLSLRNIQQAIKKSTLQSGYLREKILAGGSSGDSHLSRESNPTIRRLLSKGRPKPQERQETMTALCQVEMLRFRVALLRQEKSRKLALLASLEKQHNEITCDNADRSCELTERYQNLHKEVERLREKRRNYVDLRETLLVKNAQLSFRRKRLMTELSHIYPVELTNGKYTICGIHLPNSEELSNTDDVSVSVALGFVAHLVQMASIFLQVPLRYPIIHVGSRSKIIDHITVKIPEREREFPLFARGKDKLKFDYGVYLLNKNIAQLRLLVGFPTSDLRATLHNVYHLLHLNQFSTLESHHRSMSGSSLDVIGSSVNVSPVGSIIAHTSSHNITSPIQLRGKHRSCKSMGSTELLFPDNKRSGSYMSPPLSHQVAPEGLVGGSNLSYSLDKGLDEYEEIKRSEDGGSSGSNAKVRFTIASSSSSSNLAHVGSEPNLVTHSHLKSLNGDQHSVTDNNSISNKQLAKDSEEGEGTLPSFSYEEDSISVTTNGTNGISDKSEFTLVSEKLEKLVDSSKCFDVDMRASNALDKPMSVSSLPEKVEYKSELSTDRGSCDLASKSEKGIKSREQFGVNLHKKVSHSDTIHKDNFSKPLMSVLAETKPDILSVRDNIEVDVGTDALAVMSDNKASNPFELENGSKFQTVFSNRQIDSHSGNQSIRHSHEESEQNRMECVGVEENVLVDNLFASVTSRTEALASHTTSFNLMSSRHGST